ncbi:DUF3750 domain-containing protein [Bartonella sp. HY038]|uniref:DUF3750 domain-containing protein n=1 Tax=Bartonella sp. HY038 TaxID=2759660 RepID=UPI0015FCABCF|nr:DUF3750 domain-containing protein [Bartonella sp. HY038]
MKWLKRLILFLLICYLLPIGASALWWWQLDRPQSYRVADWTSANFLPKPQAQGSSLYIMGARTGGMKGAISLHTWIVFKKADESQYNRYDVVGWGKALRHNAYAADAKWYSNAPFIIYESHNNDALIEKVEAAIKRYSYGGSGQYIIWPGPNSNSFVGNILRDVPEINVALPPLAVGRNFLPNNKWYFYDKDNSDLIINYHGFGGLAIGGKSGLELDIGGFVLGIDIKSLGVKIPGIGRVGF